jgi:hypothetical protein
LALLIELKQLKSKTSFLQEENVKLHALTVEIGESRAVATEARSNVALMQSEIESLQADNDYLRGEELPSI